MTLQTIRADGVDWPLLTFLDVYGYQAVDRFSRPTLPAAHRICTLDETGQVRGPTFADQVDWYGIVAWRAFDPFDAAEPCFLCGTSLDSFQLCDDCHDTAEYDA